MNLKKFSGVIFSPLISCSLCLMSCMEKEDFLKPSLGSHSSFQYHSSLNTDYQAEEEPELRFSFQMKEEDPTAVLPADKMVTVGALVSIDGSLSTGTNLSYRWNFDVFPTFSNAVIDDPTASSISFTPDVPGLYLVRLIVRDGSTNSEARYLKVRAVTGNSPPNFSISSIGLRSNGFPKQTKIWLSGIQDDGEIHLVEVDYGDGHQTVFQGKELAMIYNSIDHYYLKKGMYEVKVAMIDDKGARTEKSTMLDLTSDNEIPVLKYSANSASGTAPFTFRVDASASFDPDNNSPLHFYWDWGDGNTAYTKDVVSTHTYTKPGAYEVYAYVADSKEGEKEHLFMVYVDDPNNPGTYTAPAGNTPPVISLANTALNIFAGEAPLTVNFDASESFDLEGDSFEAFWYFSNSPYREYEKGLTVSKTFNNPGRHLAFLGLRDSKGNESMRYFNVYVYDSSVEEKPRFFARQQSNDPYKIKFNASTEELYGVPARYRFWNSGDGNLSRSLNTYTYSQDGMYPVTLSTIDMFGKRQSVSKLLNIDGEKHAIDAVGQPYYRTAQVGASIPFNGERSSTAVSGGLDFFWHLMTGVREAVKFNYSYSARGVYRNIVYATNQYGLSDRRTQVIAVNSGEDPKAMAKLSTYIGPAPLTVSFDAGFSQSPGTITEYYWDLGNYDEDIDRGRLGANFSYTYKQAGVKYPELYIKDSHGNFGFKYYELTVLDPSDIDPSNQNPTATIDTNNITADGLILNMASAISDPDGEISYTEWDWGDRTVEVFSYNESSPSHTYKSAGSYTITVRAFDDMGAIATANYSVTVSQPTPLNSARSAPEQETPSQNVIPFPSRQNDRESFFQEEREKDGCYKKADGQLRCYYNKIERRM